MNFFRGTDNDSTSETTTLTPKPGNEKKYTGNVKFIKRSKQYGFIRCKELGEDVYVHFSDTIDKIYPGSKVVFTIVENERGLKATQVKTA